MNKKMKKQLKLLVERLITVYDGKIIKLGIKEYKQIGSISNIMKHEIIGIIDNGASRFKERYLNEMDDEMTIIVNDVAQLLKRSIEEMAQGKALLTGENQRNILKHDLRVIDKFVTECDIIIQNRNNE